MNQQEMAKFTVLVNARWPARQKDEDWARAWLPDFAPYTLDDAVDALGGLQPQGSSPEGHEIVAALRERGVNADAFVGDVLHAIREFTSLRPPTREHWRSDVIFDAIQAWGGWVALCTEYDFREAATRAQFRDLVRAKINDYRTGGRLVLNANHRPMLARQSSPFAALDAAPVEGPFVDAPPEALAALRLLGEGKPMPGAARLAN